jgi:hypothetical protein
MAMTTEDRSPQPTWWRRIGEDWWAVIVGVLLMLLVYLDLVAGIPW